jgi:hypothetical protein
MLRIRTAVLVLGLIAAAASPARADVTGFLGVNTTPANRTLVGGSLGVSLLIVGFEGEYAQTRESTDALAPSLQTGTGNVFVQNPIPIFGVTFYAITGAGLYHESLGPSSDTGFAVNTGLGAKIDLVSHVRLRVDYRVFKLAGSPKNATPKRIYVGLNLGL